MKILNNSELPNWSTRSVFSQTRGEWEEGRKGGREHYWKIDEMKEMRMVKWEEEQEEKGDRPISSSGMMADLRGFLHPSTRAFAAQDLEWTCNRQPGNEDDGGEGEEEGGSKGDRGEKTEKRERGGDKGKVERGGEINVKGGKGGRGGKRWWETRYLHIDNHGLPR